MRREKSEDPASLDSRSRQESATSPDAEAVSPQSARPERLERGGRVASVRSMRIHAMLMLSFAVSLVAATILGFLRDALGIPYEVVAAAFLWFFASTLALIGFNGWHRNRKWTAIATLILAIVLFAGAGALIWPTIRDAGERLRNQTSVASQNVSIRDLRAVLNGADAQARIDAARSLGATGDQRAIRPLATALRSDDAALRAEAAMSLGRIGGQEAIAPLVAALASDQDATVREKAAWALGMIKLGSAVAPLANALHGDRDAVVRSAAARSLGQIGGESVVASLATALLRDHEAAVRSTVVLALGATRSELAIAPLAAASRGDGDVSVRSVAVSTLGEIGGASAVAPLVAALQSDDVALYVYAAEALGRIGDARAASALATALQGDSPALRDAAAQALGKLGAAGVEPLLAALIRGDSTWAVQSSLREIGAPAVEPLLALLQSPDDDLLVRAAGALNGIDDERISGALESAFERRDLRVIAATYSHFILLGRPGTESVLIDALGQHGSQWMATDYLNCGNAQLEEAARRWAHAHGYGIMPSVGGGSIQWGGG